MQTKTKTIAMILLVAIATIGSICLATVTTVKTTLADSSRTLGGQPPGQPNPGGFPGNNGQCQKAAETAGSGILESGCDNHGYNGPGHK